MDRPDDFLGVSRFGPVNNRRFHFSAFPPIKTGV